MSLSRIIVAVVAIGCICAAAGLLLTRPQTVPASAIVARTADMKNGEALFDIGGCASCHKTEGQADRLRLGGGHVLKSPFGDFVVPNISSDAKHGIGAWSERDFLSAMLKGTGRNGEHLYPAFPYTSYQRMSQDDVRDLFAFMKTLPADPTPTAPHRLPFPFNVRLGLGLWKLLHLDGRTYRPDPGRDAAYNRGAYLVEGPGHCAECHSGRNLLGGIKSDRRFAGGAGPGGGGWVPNMTPHADGLAEWSAKDIEYFLQSGMTPLSYSVANEMADVIANTSRLSAADRAAMALYIKSLPPREGRAPPAPAK